jgi:hypothetical protein
MASVAIHVKRRRRKDADRIHLRAGQHLPEIFEAAVAAVDLGQALEGLVGEIADGGDRTIWMQVPLKRGAEPPADDPDPNLTRRLGGGGDWSQCRRFQKRASS